MVRKKKFYVPLIKRLKQVLRASFRHLSGDAGARLSDVVYWFGVDRFVFFISRVPISIARSYGARAIGRATRSLDPKLELKAIRLSGDGRSPMAVQRLVRVLVQAQKYDQARYWLDWLARFPEARRVKHELAIKILFRENDILGVERYLSEESDIPEDIAGISLVEIGVRLADEEILRQGLYALVENRPKGRRDYFAWLRSMLDRMPENPKVVSGENSRLILAVSRSKEPQHLYLRLAAHLNPQPSGRRLESTLDYLVELEQLIAANRFTEAASFAQNEPDLPSNISIAAAVRLQERRMAALGAVGAPVDGLAEKIVLSAMQSDQNEFLARFFRLAMGRAPSAPRLLQAYTKWAQQVGWRELATLCAKWESAYCADRAWPKPRTRRCFIVANGPSISTMPLHMLANEDVFIVNRGYEAIHKGLPVPRFLVVSDPAVYRDYRNEIGNLPVEARFIAGACLVSVPGSFGERAYTFGTGTVSLARGMLIPTASLMHNAGTVVMVACQIAHFMGYREINILGVDLNYSGPVTHFYGGGAKESRRLASFRTGEAGANGINKGMANLALVLNGWGSTLWNVGRGGQLDVLPRRSFESAVA